jgi:hypothetical protein
MCVSVCREKLCVFECVRERNREKEREKEREKRDRVLRDHTLLIILPTVWSSFRTMNVPNNFLQRYCRRKRRVHNKNLMPVCASFVSLVYVSFFSTPSTNVKHSCGRGLLYSLKLSDPFGMANSDSQDKVRNCVG